MIDLKPCPFCNEIPEREIEGEDVIYTHYGCLVIEFYRFYEHEDKRATVWNNRPVEDALRAKLAKAEKVISAASEIERLLVEIEFVTCGSQAALVLSGALSNYREETK